LSDSESGFSADPSLAIPDTGWRGLMRPEIIFHALRPRPVCPDSSAKA
jgi:hypothetical protein